MNYDLHKQFESSKHYGEMSFTEWLEQELTKESTKKKRIIQFGLDGEKIKVFKNIKEASEATKTNRNGIARCCKGEYRTSGGFRWRFESHTPSID